MKTKARTSSNAFTRVMMYIHRPLDVCRRSICHVGCTKRLVAGRRVGVIILALTFMMVLANPAQAWWTYLDDTGTPVYTYYLGDKLAYIFDFAVNEDTGSMDVDYGLGKSTDGSSWSWYNAEWSHLDGNNRYWKSTANQHQFTSTGNWYYSGRFAWGSPGNYTEYASAGWQENRTTLSASSYFTVSALSDPSSFSATADGEDQIDLSWTQWNSKNVMIVRRKGSSVAWSPTQGTDYSDGQSLGSDTYVVEDSIGGTSFSDTNLNAGTHYYYKIYSENYLYYSSGATDDDTTDSPTSVVWDGGGGNNDFGTGDNWVGDAAPATGADVFLFFQGSTRLTPNNNYTVGDEFGYIYFDSTSSFDIEGNAFDIAVKIENSNTAAQAISANMTASGSGLEINPVAGNISIDGSLTAGSVPIEIYNDDDSVDTKVILNGALSGTSTIDIKQKAILEVASSSTGYSGEPTVQEGELWFASGGAFGGGEINLGVHTDGGSIAKVWITDNNGGTTVDEAIDVYDGDTATHRVIGGLNATGDNTYSGNISFNTSGDGATNVTLSAYNAGGRTIFSGGMGGSGKQVVIDGSGTVQFNADKIFSGDIIINSGSTLELGADNVLDGTVSIEISSGGTYDLNGYTEAIQGLTGAGSAIVDAGEILEVISDDDMEFSGDISGAGSFYKDGTGTMTLSGVNTYSGITRIDEGYISISADSALGTAPGSPTAGHLLFDSTSGDQGLIADGTFTLNANRGITFESGDATTIKVTTGNTMTYNGTASGSGDFYKDDPGTLILGGNNDGDLIYVDDGVLDLRGSDPWDASTLYLGAALGTDNATLAIGASGVTLDTDVSIRTGSTGTKTIRGGYGAGTSELSGNVSLSDDVTLAATAGGDLLFSGVISGAGSYDVTVGASGYAGNVVFEAENTYAGATTVGNGGTLEIDMASGDPLDTSGITLGGTTDAGRLTLNTSSGVTIDNPITFGGNATVDAVILNEAGDNTISGGISVNAVNAHLYKRIHATGGSLTVATGAVALGDLNKGIMISNTVDVTVSSAITGTDAYLVKHGTGTLTLSGANTFARSTADGLMYIYGGELKLQDDDAGGGTSDKIYLGYPNGYGGSYDVQLTLDTGVSTLPNGIETRNGSGAITIENSSDSARTLSGNIVLGEAVTFGGNTETLTLSGIVSGAGNITKTDSGNLYLTSGANTFSGELIINQGEVLFDEDADLGADPGSPDANHIQLNGGTLYLYSGASATETLDSDRGITLGAGGGTIQVYNGKTLEYAGVITGGNALIKDGGGTLTLSGANDYSGGTTVSGGTLKGDTTSLQGNISVNASQDLEFSQAGDGTYSGQISGAGDFTKTGTGNVTLSGTSGLTGTTAVEEGTLTVSGSLSSSDFTVESGSTIAGAGTIGDIEIDGTVAPGNGGVGELTCGTLTMNNGSKFVCELGDFTDNTDRDFIDNNGTATINATTTIEMDSSQLSNWDNTQAESWTIIEGGITSTNNFSLDQTTSWDSGTYPLAGGTFELSASGGNLVVTFSPPPVPDVTLADNGTQVQAANQAAGTTAVVLHKFSLAVSSADTTLTQVDFTTAGTYDANDLDNLKLRYSTDSSLDGGDATLKTISSPAAAGAKSFTSLSQAITDGNTGYFFITADIASDADAGNTVSVSAVGTDDLTFDVANKSGSTTGGGAQTITSAVTIDNTGTPAAGDVTAGTDNAVLFGFRITPATGSIDFTGLSLDTAGDADTDDLSNFEVVYDADSSGTYNGGDSIVSSAAQSLADPISFTISGETGISAARRYLVIADISSTAVDGHTFTANIAAAGDITTTGTESGTAAGNQQTIDGAITISNTGTPAEQDVAVNTSDAVLFGFQLAIVGEIDFTGLSLDTAGTADSGDLSNFEVIYDADGDGEVDGGESAVSSAAQSLGDPISFTIVGETGISGTRKYLVIADVASDATAGSTFTANIAAAGDVTTTGAESGTAAGNEQTFVTTPTLTTPTSTLIGQTSATLGATVSDMGGAAALSSRGTVYNTTGSPVTENSAAEGGTGSGAFTDERTSLSAGTKYYYRGYAVNAAGTAYSPQGSFYTEPGQASSISFANVGGSSIRISWTAGANSDGTIVVVRQSNSTITDPTDGTLHSADAVFGDGDDLGSGSYVVYRGSGTQVDVTGLSEGATYYVEAFAYAGTVADNGVDLGINYQKTSPATGNQETISDPSAASATADGKTFIDLAWTKDPSFNVMIVHKTGSAPSAPTDGTSYSVGASCGGGKVVYKGSGSSLEHVVPSDTTHYYVFYSYSGDDYYSAGLSRSATTLAFADGEIVDTFSYTNSTTIASTGGGSNGWNGAWTGDTSDYSVQSDSFSSQANYPTPKGNKVMVDPAGGTVKAVTRLKSGSKYSSGSVYASYIINIEYGGHSSGQEKWSGAYLMEDGNQRVFFGESGGGDQVLAVHNTTSAKAMTAGTGNDYIVIIKYDISNDDAYASVYKIGTDTVPITEPASWDAEYLNVNGGTGFWINGIRLVSGGNGSATPGETFFDEVRIATSWNDLLVADDSDPVLPGTGPFASNAFFSVATGGVYLEPSSGSGTNVHYRIPDNVFGEIGAAGRSGNLQNPQFTDDLSGWNETAGNNIVDWDATAGDEAGGSLGGLMFNAWDDSEGAFGEVLQDVAATSGAEIAFSALMRQNEGFETDFFGVQMQFLDEDKDVIGDTTYSSSTGVDTDVKRISVEQTSPANTEWVRVLIRMSGPPGPGGSGVDVELVNGAFDGAAGADITGWTRYDTIAWGDGNAGANAGGTGAGIKFDAYNNNGSGSFQQDVECQPDDEVTFQARMRQNGTWSSTFFGVRIQFLDSGDSVIGGTTYSSTEGVTTLSKMIPVTATAPAGTEEVRCIIEMTGSPGGSDLFGYADDASISGATSAGGGGDQFGYVDNCQLTGAGEAGSGSASLTLTFTGYDAESGLSRGTTERGTQTHISVTNGLASWKDDDVLAYNSVRSSGFEDTKLSTGTSTWYWATLSQVDFSILLADNYDNSALGDGYAEDSRNPVTNRVTVALANSLSGDNRLWITNQYGYLSIQDDDVDPPSPQLLYTGTDVIGDWGTFNEDSKKVTLTDEEVLGGGVDFAYQWYDTSGIFLTNTTQAGGGRPVTNVFEMVDGDTTTANVCPNFDLTNETFGSLGYDAIHGTSELFGNNGDLAITVAVQNLVIPGIAKTNNPVDEPWVLTVSAQDMDDDRGSFTNVASSSITDQDVPQDRTVAINVPLTFKIIDDDTDGPVIDNLTLEHGDPMTDEEFGGGAWTLTVDAQDEYSGLSKGDGTATSPTNISPYLSIYSPIADPVVLNDVFDNYGDIVNGTSGKASAFELTTEVPAGDYWTMVLGTYTVTVSAADADDDRYAEADGPNIDRALSLATNVGTFTVYDDDTNAPSLSSFDVPDGGSAGYSDLEPGYIAIVGFNFDNEDEFSFLCLVDIAAGTEISFTDNGWNGSALSSDEGRIDWVAPDETLPANTIVTITFDDATGEALTTHGSADEKNSFALSSSGDQILAYQGDAGDPTFIYALNSEATGWQGTWNDEDNAGSQLPEGLTDGTTAVAIDEIDNAVYDMSTTSDSTANLLAAIGNQANWDGENTTRQTLPPSGSFSVSDAPIAARELTDEQINDGGWSFEGVVWDPDSGINTDGSTSETNTFPPFFDLLIADGGQPAGYGDVTFTTQPADGGATTPDSLEKASMAAVDVADVELGIYTATVYVTDNDYDRTNDQITTSLEYTFTVIDDDKKAPLLESMTLDDDGPTAATASDLFISAYVEGDGFDKYIAIFNGTGDTVDMSDYELGIYYNGDTEFTGVDNPISLSGSLPAGEIFVIGHTSADSWDGTPDQTSGQLNFNGNDVIALRKNSSNIDVLGEIGEATYFAQDAMQRRHPDTQGPTTDYSAADWITEDIDMANSALTSHSNPVTDHSLVSGDITIAGTIQDYSGILTSVDEPNYTIWNNEGDMLFNSETFGTGPDSDGDATTAEALSDELSALSTNDITSLGVYTARVLAVDYDGDRTGDSLIRTQFISFAVIDDDTNYPTISNPTVPEVISYAQTTVLTTELADATSDLIPAASRLIYGYGAPDTGLDRTAGAATGGLYTFTLPTQEDHIGETINFYIETSDADSDRVNDALWTTNDNSGSNYSIIITNYTPVITNGPTLSLIFNEDGILTNFAAVAPNVGATDLESVVALDWDTNSAPTDGTLVINGTDVEHPAVFNYTPDADWYGDDSFVISVDDDRHFGTNTITVNVSVQSVNDEPEMSLSGSDLTSFDLEGGVTNAGWASLESVGPANEAAQSLSAYIVSNNNNSLFAEQPAIDTDGDLTYVVNEFAYGVTTVSVWAVDDGGVERGGDDTSQPTNFIIFVEPSAINATQGVNEVSQVIIEHDRYGTENELIYANAADWSDSLGYRSPWNFADTGSGSFTNDPTDLAFGMSRFFRVSRKKAWTNDAVQRASDEVYILRRIKLVPTVNWVSLPGVPDNATVGDVFGHSLPSGVAPPNSSQGTYIQWYGSSGEDWTVTQEVYLASGNSQWYYSVPSGGGSAEEVHVPRNQPIIVHLPEGSGTQEITFIGRVPTNTMEGVWLKGRDSSTSFGYTFICPNYPHSYGPADLQLREGQVGGFQSYRNAIPPITPFADQMWKWNRDIQQVDSSGGFPVVYDHIDGRWEFGNTGAAVPDNYFSPDDAIIISLRSPGSADGILWTNKMEYSMPSDTLQ